MNPKFRTLTVVDAGEWPEWIARKAADFHIERAEHESEEGREAKAQAHRHAADLHVRAGLLPPAGTPSADAGKASHAVDHETRGKELMRNAIGACENARRRMPRSAAQRPGSEPWRRYESRRHLTRRRPRPRTWRTRRSSRRRASASRGARTGNGRPGRAPKDDLKFYFGDSENGYQWPLDIRQQRDIQRSPTLTINMARQFALNVINDSRQHRAAIKVRPRGRRRDV